MIAYGTGFLHRKLLQDSHRGGDWRLAYQGGRTLAAAFTAQIAPRAVMQVRNAYGQGAMPMMSAAHVTIEDRVYAAVDERYDRGPFWRIVWDRIL